MEKIIKHAKTFTCNYIEREDRLLLTLNYEDPNERTDFWITRAFLLKLVPYFFDYMLEDISLESNSELTSPTDNTTYTLTFKEPILLDSVDITPMEDGNVHFVLKNLEHNVYAVSTLSRELFDKVIKLILAAAPQFSWGINIK
jgi:hypothetical protein